MARPARATRKIATLLGYPATYGDLLLNPCWDDLRGDPRFDKIVAAAKTAVDNPLRLRSKSPRP